MPEQRQTTVLRYAICFFFNIFSSFFCDSFILECAFHFFTGVLIHPKLCTLLCMHSDTLTSPCYCAHAIVHVHVHMHFVVLDVPVLALASCCLGGTCLSLNPSYLGRLRFGLLVLVPR